MELGFRIPIVKEIADSLSCIERIPKLRILMPQAKISRNSEFGFPNYGATVCLKVRYCVRKKNGWKQPDVSNDIKYVTEVVF